MKVSIFASIREMKSGNVPLRATNRMPTVMSVFASTKVLRYHLSLLPLNKKNSKSRNKKSEFTAENNTTVLKSTCIFFSYQEF